MSIEIAILNGQSPYINYDDLQKTAKDTFLDKDFDVNIVVFNNFPITISPQVVIDLVFFINIQHKTDKSKILEIDGKKFKNLIIPIKIANNESFEGVTVKNLDFELVEEIFSTDVFLMKAKFSNYLKL